MCTLKEEIPNTMTSHAHYAARILWIIWKIAEPHTTNTKRASIQGPTGYFSSLFFRVLGTFPRCVTFLEARSLATRIRCFAAILENWEFTEKSHLRLVYSSKLM